MSPLHRATRSSIAAMLTFVVGLLVVINLASIRTTGIYVLSLRADGYAPVPPSTVVRRADLSEFGDRVHLRLGQTTRELSGAEPPGPEPGRHPFHAEDGRELWPIVARIKAAYSVPLVFAELLFAGFGLFVLWWGRDRSSLWLGVGCAALAPRLLPVFGDVSPPAMVVAQISADLLTYLAFYALYAMADSVAGDVLAPADPLRPTLGIVRRVVAVAVTFGACADAAGILDAVWNGPRLPLLDRIAVGTELFAWVTVFCLLPPIVLAIAALRAVGDASRKRARVVLVATTLGLSGVCWSIAAQLWRNGFSFAYQPHFETAWFTLLLLPLAFIVAIRAYGVVEIRFILRRIIVFTVLTLVVTAIISAAEKLFDGLIELVFSHEAGPEAHHAGFAPEQTLVAFAIVIVLERLHGLLERNAERIVFRDRDRAVEDLEAFAERAPSLRLPVTELFDRASESVRSALRAEGVAVYAWETAGYALAASSGSLTWPNRPEPDDPAFAEDGPGDGADSDRIAFPMSVGPRRIGRLIVASRAGASETPYDAEECSAVARVATQTAAVAFALQAEELAAIARAFFRGSIHAKDLRSRAKALAENPLVSDAQDAPTIKAG